jgi:hypothetical protein
MPTRVEGASNCLRKSLCIQVHVLEGHNLVVTSVVDEDSWDTSRLCFEILGQCNFLIPLVAPAIAAPIRCRHQKEAADLHVDFFLGKTFEKK